MNLLCLLAYPKTPSDSVFDATRCCPVSSLALSFWMNWSGPKSSDVAWTDKRAFGPIRNLVCGTETLAVAAIVQCKQIRQPSGDSPAKLGSSRGLNVHSGEFAVRGTSSRHSWPRGWHTSRDLHEEGRKLPDLAFRIVMDSTISTVAVSSFHAGLLQCSAQRRLRPRIQL